MAPETLTERLKAEARRLGFDLAGAAPAVVPPGLGHFRRWLEEGFAGRMEYLAARAGAYGHPRHVLDGVRSLLMLAVGYRTSEPAAAGPGQGRVARYAWGTDYHGLVRERLHVLADYHRRLTPGAGVRGVVDTAPLLERDFARLAGLGWIGKNTMLIHRERGSWLFLAALLTSEELAYDTPFTADHCGSCRACLDACPTGALVAPYRLDARRCISYLTIELREPVPRALQGATGEWLFGCDVCQEVCPWNRRAPATWEPAFAPEADLDPADAAELLALDEAAFRRRFRHSPLGRPRRAGLLRNAALVLGNQPVAAALPALSRALSDPEPLVRGAAAWALGRYRSPPAREALRARLPLETHAAVAGEIRAAIAEG